MVTSYYMMKMSMRKTNIELDKYYDSVYYNQYRYKNVIHFTTQMCRICLKEGTISIYDDNNTNDITEALHIFGNINVNKDDEYPKYLCDICYKFIKTAIAFKKIAIQTDEILKQPMKDELITGIINFENDLSKVEEKQSPCLNFTSIGKSIIKKRDDTGQTKFSLKVQCNICNSVVRKSYFKEHMTMHEPDHYKYVCDICGKSFRLQCAYRNHSLRHRTDFAYKCQFCPYKAKYSALLKTHMRTHTGDYKYMCTECPARFLFKSNLNSHMLKHREPQYKCDACKRAFHKKILLQRHFDSDHLGIKNHVCDICNKAFGTRNAMMKHQIGVHKREKISFRRMPSYLEAEMANT